jgi:hypothetical protein
VNGKIQGEEHFQLFSSTTEVIEEQERDMFSSAALVGPGKCWIDVASVKAVKPHRSRPIQRVVLFEAAGCRLQVGC